MTAGFNTRIWTYFCGFLALSGISACQQAGKPGKADSLAMRAAFAESPVLTAQQSLETFRLENGFTAQVVAAEPQVIVPVAMTFDHRGRMWVAEMTGYMPDTAGTGEDAPNGKIVILEDTNGDGTADTRTVFLDSLVLPRALAIINNGLLVAEPPRLWFVEIINDKPGRKTLVDSGYTEGGNVEHQPNGLLRAMDNWIYSAKSSKRYRFEKGKWKKEDTHFRGQWGITQDDQGRLYYNNNSENLLGDYFSPGLGSHNPNQRRVEGFDENIVPDNRTYPIRPTPGVNRGYMKGVLDDSLRLVNFTAACGPVIYRDPLFGEGFNGNAFVAEPSANLIKRNVLRDSGYFVRGKQAYAGREFLASTDERFRPVNLSLGPDGALYILDMYRGIIQHKTYLTPYLKKEIGMRELSDPLNCGRIYRIFPTGAKPVAFQLKADPASLIAALDHQNGWIRDKAQQMLVDAQQQAVVPQLRARLGQPGIGRIHAMWALEGLHAITAADLLPLLDTSDAALCRQALSVLPSILNKTNAAQLRARLAVAATSAQTAPAVAYILPAFAKSDAPGAQTLLAAIWQRFPDSKIVADAVIGNAHNKEQALLTAITQWNPDTNLVVRRRLEKVLVDISNHRKARLDEALIKEYPRGNLLFKTICQTCHGADGEGIQSLAPPLNHSELVTGKKERLIAIVLYGLTGPVQVNGKLYKSPEINGDMPGIASNDEFSDSDIAQLMSFIRNAWSNKAEKVTEREVQAVRKQYKGRQKSFTMEELK
ncbi:c-type cytochrome [Chitinophaga pollutisoli]|uniref:C-type cytochrome n=1 Tax=Chitinophaga pollutisoli TaxID=3133966 RepID=A0ABZ2YMI2_9BACT